MKSIQYALLNALRLLVAAFIGWQPLQSLSQTMVHRFDSINGHLGLMAVSNNGAFFVLGGWDDISIRQNDTGKEWLYLFLGKRLSPNRKMGSVAISSDDALLAWVDGEGVHIFDLQLKTVVSEFQDTEALTHYYRGPIKFKPGSHEIAVRRYGADDVDILDAMSGNLIQRIFLPGATPEHGDIAFSKNGNIIAYGGGSAGENMNVHVFDTQNQQTVRVFKTSNTFNVPDVDLSDDGRWLATGAAYRYDGSEEPSVEIWDIHRGERVGNIDVGCEYLCFMDEGRFLAVLTTPISKDDGVRSEQLQFWRLSDMAMMKSIELKGEGNTMYYRHSMLGLADGSGVMIQSRGPNRLLEENGESLTIPTTQLAIITAPPMISSLSLATPGSLSLKWGGGGAPFQLLFRENLDAPWNTIEEGILMRSITIPLNKSKHGFYGIRTAR